MATAQEVSTTISEIQAIAAQILNAVEVFVPSATVPIQIAEEIATLVTKALSAWTQASGIPITVESVQALLPDPTPLSPPTA